MTSKRDEVISAYETKHQTVLRDYQKVDRRLQEIDVEMKHLQDEKTRLEMDHRNFEEELMHLNNLLEVLNENPNQPI